MNIEADGPAEDSSGRLAPRFALHVTAAVAVGFLFFLLLPPVTGLAWAVV